jgi:hypothetical protein
MPTPVWPDDLAPRLFGFGCAGGCGIVTRTAIVLVPAFRPDG